jgi:hypothetical protein
MQIGSHQLVGSSILEVAFRRRAQRQLSRLGFWEILMAFIHSLVFGARNAH